MTHDPPPALESIGLGADHEEVYRILLEQPPSTLGEIRELAPAGLAGRLPAILAALENKGLVSRGSDDRHTPLPPYVAIEALLAGRETALKQARDASAELLRRYRATHRQIMPERVIEVLDDTDIHRSAMRVQRLAREEVLVRSGRIDGAMAREVLTRGVAYRHLVPCPLDEDMPEKGKLTRTLSRLGAEFRKIDSVARSYLLICDRRLVLAGGLPASDAPALLIHPSLLLDALHELFQRQWARVPPGPGSTFPSGAHMGGRTRRMTGTTPEEPSAADRKLLSLLAEGATDASAAVQLGVSERTVHRRVRALMESLGASSRLQAGSEACRRGWL